MRRTAQGLFKAAVTVGLFGPAAVHLGCAKNPPPPRVPVPARDNRDVILEREDRKPLPPHAEGGAMQYEPAYEDLPLINQRPPEQQAFVDAYNAVGRPRITVFVNRTLEGDIVPVNLDLPVASVEHTRRSTTGVSVERRETNSREGYYDRDRNVKVDRFDSKGPAEYRETTEVFLRPGEYDEVGAKALDYEAVETVLTDWLAANGRVTVISPSMARQRLSDQQIKELQEGRPQALSEIAQQLGTDVLVQAQARPTRQTPQGLEVRIIVEALNVKGGDQLGRAVVDVPPPLDKYQVNKYTRYLARKLMDDMAGAWENPAPPQQAPPPPAQQQQQQQSPQPQGASRRQEESAGPQPAGELSPPAGEPQRPPARPAPATRPAVTTGPVLP